MNKKEIIDFMRNLRDRVFQLERNYYVPYNDPTIKTCHGCGCLMFEATFTKKYITQAEYLKTDIIQYEYYCGRCAEANKAKKAKKTLG